MKKYKIEIEIVCKDEIPNKFLDKECDFFDKEIVNGMQENMDVNFENVSVKWKEVK